MNVHVDANARDVDMNTVDGTESHLIVALLVSWLRLQVFVVAGGAGTSELVFVNCRVDDDFELQLHTKTRVLAKFMAWEVEFLSCSSNLAGLDYQHCPM